MSMPSRLGSTRESPGRDVRLYSVLCPNVISLLLSTKKCSSLPWIQAKGAMFAVLPKWSFPAEVSFASLHCSTRGFPSEMSLVSLLGSIREITCKDSVLVRKKFFTQNWFKGFILEVWMQERGCLWEMRKCHKPTVYALGLYRDSSEQSFSREKTSSERLDFMLWLTGSVFRAWLVSLHRVCMFSSSGVECGFLALILGPICVFFTGSGFKIRACFFRWTFYPTHRTS